MFETVGFTPIISALLFGLGLIMSCTFLGGFFKVKEKFKALTFLVGLIYLISCFAVINSGILSFFTPLVFAIPVVLGVQSAFFS